MHKQGRNGPHRKHVPFNKIPNLNCSQVDKKLKNVPHIIQRTRLATELERARPKAWRISYLRIPSQIRNIRK